MRVSFVFFFLVVILHLQSILMQTVKLCMIRYITGLWRNIRTSSTVPELKRCIEIWWGAVVGPAGMNRLLPLTQPGKVLLTLDEDSQLYMTQDASHRRPACLLSMITFIYKIFKLIYKILLLKHASIIQEIHSQFYVAKIREVTEQNQIFGSWLTLASWMMLTWDKNGSVPLEEPHFHPSFFIIGFMVSLSLGSSEHHVFIQM